MSSVIQVKDLTKIFKIRTNKNLVTGLFDPKHKHVNAVKNVSFEVKQGESLAFLGPNGAGKTTTTKILTGLMYPTSGSVQVLDYTPQERDHAFLRQIGLVMGNKSGLSWDLTPNQSFRLLKQIYLLSDTEYAQTLTNLCEILDTQKHLDTPIRNLSLGERMKMELIGAILHNPKVLFLDEPTIGLDITSKKRIRKFLRELQTKKNITLILTSHDMDDVESVCDRVLIINKGQKIYDGMLPKLVDEYSKTKFVKVYFDKIPTNLESISFASLDNMAADSVTFEVTKDNLPHLLAHIGKYEGVLDIDILTTPLEDIIEDLFLAGRLRASARG